MEADHLRTDMARLLIHVEGQTEEDFVNEVLHEYLRAKGFESVSARIVGNARVRQGRGGIKPWPSVKKDIVAHLKEDATCIATTMVDFYALPRGANGGWPGRDAAQGSAIEKAAHVESAISADIALEMGDRFNARRFVPYVVMHEFEALLFSDCVAFSQGIGRPHLAQQLQAVRNGFESPEEIDDSPVTAPSKRIELLVPGYEKPLLGVLGILSIGLDQIRSECPCFDGWLTKLEG